MNKKSDKPNTQSKLSVRYGGHSTAGIKDENQDAFAAYQGSGQARETKGAVACMADGVSCSEYAQQASQMLVAQFIDDYLSAPDTWRVKTAASKILSSLNTCLLYTSPSPRDQRGSRMPSSA